MVLVNFENLDDEYFIDIFLNEDELEFLNGNCLITTEKRIDGRIVHIGLLAPKKGTYDDNEEESDSETEES